MIKVIPYNKTMGSEKYREFLATPFKIDMLYPVFDDQSTQTLFDDWRGKDMINWYKFTNDDYVLEFYPTYYSLIKKKSDDTKPYMMSIPETIDDFINDMDRFGVQLYWTSWIDQNFEPKDYLPTNEIKNYFTNLLAKMGKSEELL